MHETTKRTVSRKKTRALKVGNIYIGGQHPVTVQSMTRSKTEDWKSTVDEIKILEAAGCEIVRSTANTVEAAEALKKIREHITIPLVADIHFDYKLALLAVQAGVHKIRINPGNIGSNEKIREVVKACKDSGIPIRIGVNSGSLEKDILKKYQRPTPEAMIESALRHIEILERNNFNDIIVALKSSSVIDTIAACKMFSQKMDYPLHLGVTEAGSPFTGSIKSAMGIGTLLYEGIGDTIRVSLTGKGVEEVQVGMEILKGLGYRNDGVEIISCPTCGRLESDLFSVLTEVENELAHIRTPLKIAIMGCLVNGPGESREADIGVSLGKENAVFYVDGKSRGMIEFSEISKRIVEEAKKKMDSIKKNAAQS
ncbi:MAG: flavodoxin-dependent (E)-4-hydroxy-3-methylbut-2-enyl-diphosphate synthase [Spirochaetia bacterium]|nr:flavodoxin-dependent (E)-4-hydroxy-3-methylbut-2-enyl-diphosphate synthase [Spirochaetia bacterium]